MRIAQVAPLFESVPPRLYGGTERVVSFLTEELVRLGHDVTLFASGDSETSARLVPVIRDALRLAPTAQDPVIAHLLLVDEVVRRAGQFDVIHFHTEPWHYPLCSRADVPALTTLHGRLDLQDLVPLYRRFPESPVVSISDDQRRPLWWLRWVATVHHGLPTGLFALGQGSGDYLVFLGRVSREKRPDRAIAIARRSGLPLKIAAKIDALDRSYFEEHIRPLLDPPAIELVGEVDERQKQALLADARALLFPIDWPEPFGLVMIEAMACGTPVIAWPRGSVPEVLDDGVTGFVVQSIEEAAKAVERAATVDRARCRERMEERFSVERMAADYVRVYERLIQRRRGDGLSSPSLSHGVAL